MNDRSYRKTVLSNGIRVLTERMPQVRSAAIGLWVGVGSAHEAPSLRGISHCIEHMLFKGTATRSARDIAELMDSIGGHLNAFTDKESTCYHARIVDAHVPLALEVLADMFVHSLFDPAELHKEQQVILEEIRMYDDSPDEVSQDLFLKSVWQGSSLGEPTIGYAETVSAVTRDAITAYMQQQYRPSSVVLSAVGNVDHEPFVAAVEARLGAMTPGTPPPDAPEPIFVPASIVKQKDCEQVYVLVGAEGVSARDDRRYTMAVLDAILGGGMASRLFQEIREKRGLAYSIYSTHNIYRSGGLFTVAASTRAKNAQEVVRLIRDELQRAATLGVESGELSRAKEHLKGSLLLSLESTSTRMLRLGRSELNLGRHVPIAEITASIDAVTKKEVDAAARRAFDADRLALTVVGPVDGAFEATSGSLAQSA
ncbi:MAG: insulinase family protein [Candidatus Eremiobacteraeota bacterium]|nr:insulinase family protein [Candidatus Eremiobacteraeota bacterium]MBC5827971.1 insulinase family protein [Candidatus Eremiobacteraeota bacterium]